MNQQNTSIDPSSLARGMEYRHPFVSDASRIHTLVEACQVLETNTCYAYLLLCRDFADTSLVAYYGDELCGFVMGYTPPPRPDSLFVWQVGVGAHARRIGLGKSLLMRLWQSDSCRHLRVMEATVTPSNEASRRLFASVAKEREATFEILPGFTSADFGGGHPAQHEPEETIRIRLPGS